VNKSLPILDPVPSINLSEKRLDYIALTKHKYVLKTQLTISAKAIDQSGIRIFSPYKQQLTHQTIQARFIVVPLKTIPAKLSKANWVSVKQLQKLAFPKLLNEFLQSDFQKI
jgi:hypothetical protein